MRDARVGGPPLHTPMNIQDAEEDLNQLWAAAVQAFQQSAAKTLPTLTVEAGRLWISAATLGSIQCMKGARTAKDFEAEADYNKRIRSSARADRRKWLEDLAATGDWTRIRKLRTKPRPQQGRLKDAAGNIVSSEHRAETMAEYFERVQWAVRPVTAHRFEEHLGKELPVNCGPVTEVEVRRAATRFKNNRACGLDNVPAEFWNALFCTAGLAATWATDFCKLCWGGKSVLESWHMPRVMAISKKR